MEKKVIPIAVCPDIEQNVTTEFCAERVSSIACVHFRFPLFASRPIGSFLFARGVLRGSFGSVRVGLTNTSRMSQPLDVDELGRNLDFPRTRGQLYGAVHCRFECAIALARDNDNDTLREVPHQSNEGLALQARVLGPWPLKKESVLLGKLAPWQGVQIQTVMDRV